MRLSSGAEESLCATAMPVPTKHPRTTDRARRLYPTMLVKMLRNPFRFPNIFQPFGLVDNSFPDLVHYMQSR